MNELDKAAASTIPDKNTHGFCCIGVKAHMDIVAGKRATPFFPSFWTGGFDHTEEATIPVDLQEGFFSNLNDELLLSFEQIGKLLELLLDHQIGLNEYLSKVDREDFHGWVEELMYGDYKQVQGALSAPLSADEYSEQTP